MTGAQTQLKSVLAWSICHIPIIIIIWERDGIIDTLSMFEQKLKTSNQPIGVDEENWDQRAKTFYHNQINGSTYYSDAVPRLLERKGILTPSSRVLDIGAGSGRSKSDHGLDLSSEMLQFMQREIEKNNLNNIYTIKSAWPTTENIGQFDVAFSAMCPATRSVETLEAMSGTAKKHGVLCQFTASTDNVVETLKGHQLIDGDIKGPHNDRDILQSYFNILWELGYQPEVSYLNDTFTLNMTFNEAFDTYKQRYEHVESEQLENVLQTIQQEEENIKAIKNTTLALVSWETERKG